MIVIVNSTKRLLKKLITKGHPLQNTIIVARVKNKISFIISVEIAIIVANSFGMIHQNKILSKNYKVVIKETILINENS